MQPRRITLVADELLGYAGNGLGTATTFLAVALARMGHEVEVLYFGKTPTGPVDSEWRRLYERVDVRVRPVLRRETSVEPPHFTGSREVELALRSEPPDVVIAQDFGAPAYCAVQLRRLGLAFESTLFVVYCHGTRQWVADMARKTRVLPGALAVTRLEQAAIELADVAVSPSAYMLDWMRQQGWRLPETAMVIPLLTRSGATGEPPPEPARTDGARALERLVFFGRLEVRKGVRPFVGALNALEPQLLADVELEFLGRATKDFTPDRVRALLSETTTSAVRGISFETSLDQHEALARLSRPGTLAVMPSLEDNSPMAVYECLERGIPFVASCSGGTGELVTPEDREHVLLEPTDEGVAAALRRVLSARGAPRSARPAFDDAVSLQQWAEVVARRPRPVAPVRRPQVDVVVVYRQSRDALVRCLAALAKQAYRELTVTVAAIGTDLPADDLEAPVVRSERRSVEAAREAGLEVGTAPWVVFLDEEDVPADEFLETLVRAQAASGADVVSCALHLADGDGGSREYFFTGEPGAVGLLGNGYGTVALLRRSLLGKLPGPWPAADADWPLLAGLSLAGATVVSVPTPLLTRADRPGTLEHHPADALLVAQHYERALPDELRTLARLAAGLAAETRPPPQPTRIVPRALHILRAEGGLGLSRRALRRLLRRPR